MSGLAGRAEAQEQELPVMMNVAGPDGKVERVRVGTALRSEHGLLLKLEQLSVEEPARSEPVSTPRPRIASQAASVADLEYLANRSRTTLADPAKARWHSEAKEQLAHIEEEIARQKARLVEREEPAQPAH